VNLGLCPEAASSAILPALMGTHRAAELLLFGEPVGAEAAREFSAFAFGIGVDRLAMLKNGIDDIQLFCQNDVRFLRQFP
jgi:hypothetical protein